MYTPEPLPEVFCKPLVGSSILSPGTINMERFFVTFWQL
jgi:hypothetical protein